MQIELVNQTVSRNCYAFITGSAIDRGNQLMLISADGKTPYYPPNPPAGKLPYSLMQLNI
jgi:Beta-1,3-glucanase